VECGNFNESESERGVDYQHNSDAKIQRFGVKECHARNFILLDFTNYKWYK
jgi:hypothetical protein